jgi:hypothetical protein
MTFSNSQPRDPNGRWSNSLLDSLEHQLKERGQSREMAHQMAVEILVQRGHLDPNTGSLTAAGQAREAMGREGRRRDVLAKATGHRPEEIAYQRGRTYVK